MSDNRCCTSKCITDFKCNTKTNKCIVNGKDSNYLCKKNADCGEELGEVDKVTISAAGSNYIKTPNGGRPVETKAITGGGSGLAIFIISVDGNGGISNITVANRGLGYSQGDTVIIKGGEGNAKVIVSGVTGPQNYCEGTLKSTPPWLCDQDTDCGRCSNGGWKHYFSDSDGTSKTYELPLGTSCNGCCAVDPGGTGVQPPGWCNMQNIPKYGVKGYGSNMDYASLFPAGGGQPFTCNKKGKCEVNDKVSEFTCDPAKGSDDCPGRECIGNKCGRTPCQNQSGSGPVLHWCGASDLAQCKNGTCTGCIIDGICQDNMPAVAGGPPPTTEEECMALGGSAGSYLPATWCGEGSPKQNNWAQKDCLQQCPNCSGNGADDSGPACSYQGEANINMCNKCKDGYSGICCQIGPGYEETNDKCRHMTEKRVYKKYFKRLEMYVGSCI